MKFEASANYLENKLDEMEGEDYKLDTDESGLMTGPDLVEMAVPSGTKTNHYLNQADERGIISTIEEYTDPIGFRAYHTEKKSFWLGTTSEGEWVAIDLTQLRALVKGNSIVTVSGGHQYEVFIKGDQEMKDNLEKMLEESYNVFQEEFTTCSACGGIVSIDESSCHNCGRDIA